MTAHTRGKYPRSSRSTALLSAWVLIVVAVNVGAFSPPVGKDLESDNDLREESCQLATIRVLKNDFEDIFHIKYDVRVLSRYPVCVPTGLSERDLSNVVVLVPAATATTFVKPLNERAKFVKTKVGRNGQLREIIRGTPSSDEVEHRVDEVHYEVAPGTYRLEFRYRPRPCHRRVFSTTCVAVSEPFELTSSVQYMTTGPS